MDLLLSTDSRSVDIVCETLVYVPIKVVLVDELFGVGERVVRVRFEGVEEGGEGLGGEGVAAGLGDGLSGSGRIARIAWEGKRGGCGAESFFCLV